MPTNTPRKNAAVVDNPRMGVLSPEQFRTIAFNALGGRGWQRSLSAATGWSHSTITRYLQGSLPVPKSVALLLECATMLRTHDLPLPDGFVFEAVDGAEGDGEVRLVKRPVGRPRKLVTA